MRGKLIGLVIFIGLFSVSPAHAASILNLGILEIIIILIVGVFFLAFFGGIIFLLYSLIKRRDSKQQVVVPKHSALNFGVPISIISTPEQQDTSKKYSVQENLKHEKIALPQQHEIRYVTLAEIIRCEADDNYTNFYLGGGEKVLISKSLKEYADLLTPKGFLRCHQSHLVNPLFVKSWLKEDGGVLLMKNGDKIPVSKPNRESIKHFLGK